MRKVLVILMLALWLLAPQPFKASAIEQDPDGASPPQDPASLKADSYPENDDDIFSSSYERELLSRRFFQKNLPPLNRREKVVWAFRTCRASILL